MLYLLDLLGTLAFAITGAFKAKSAKLNIFGVIFLGVITAVGGGTFRDLIIGRIPLFYLRDSNYLLIAILGSVITYFTPTFFKKRYSFFRLIDSIGLAAFVIIGVSVSVNYSVLASVLLGMVTGFGGGIIRDSIMGQVPFSLRSNSNYTTSAFAGAFSFYFLRTINIELAALVSIILVLVFREVISKFGILNKSVRKPTEQR
jgi:uncharacterized membrane protein YeiH